MNTTLCYTKGSSLNIEIKKNLTTQPKNISPKSEYSLKHNLFDPSKSSPPNEFMLKLYMRFNDYNSKSEDINDDNFDNE